MPWKQVPQANAVDVKETRKVVGGDAHVGGRAGEADGGWARRVSRVGRGVHKQLLFGRKFFGFITVVCKCSRRKGTVKVLKRKLEEMADEKNLLKTTYFKMESD